MNEEQKKKEKVMIFHKDNIVYGLFDKLME
jgi:hypothetical protein